MNTTWETWLRLAACVNVCVFLCRVFCVPALSVDPETCRLLYVAGGSSKAEAESSQELQRRQERATGRRDFEWTVTARHSPRVHSTTGVLIVLFLICNHSFALGNCAHRAVCLSFATLLVGAPSVGARHCASFGFEAGRLSFPPVLPDFALSEPLPGLANPSRVGCSSCPT